jgi:hypothetical protein
MGRTKVDQLSERRDRLVDILVDLAGNHPTPATLAGAASVLLGLDTATINVASRPGPRLVGAYGPLAEDIEDLQRRLGDGPTLTALEDSGPIIVLDAPSGLSRWPAFGPSAIATGISALFALPLRPRRVPPAALSLYSTGIEQFDNVRIGEVLLVTDLVAETLMNPSRDGLRERLGQVGDDRSAVHHATGIVAARKDLSPAEALSSMRTQAATAKLTIADLAIQVVKQGQPEEHA